MNAVENLAALNLFRHVESPGFADKPFVVQEGQILTYGMLSDTIGRIAKLFSDNGLMVNDRVVICSSNDLAVMTLYLAAMRLGITPALIDPDSTEDEAVVLTRAARARAVFADERLARSPRLAGELLPRGKVVTVAAGDFLAALAGNGNGNGDRSNDHFPGLLNARVPGMAPLKSPPDSTSAFILFTSGTTSRPKGVEVSLGAVSAHMKTMHRQYGYGVDCVVINSLPLHHSDGINHGPVNIMAAGGTLLRCGNFSVQKLPSILALIQQKSVTHLITVPTVLALITRLGDEFSNAFRTPSFRFVSSTAGPLDDRLWRSFEERFGTTIVNSYGLTETVCEGFYCGPSLETRRIGTIGKPVDIEVRIVDAVGNQLPPGEMGELVLRGSCVMKGYFDAPVETAEVLRDGWLYTGDLAVRDADGFYMLTGRKKNVVISGGINVYPEDVSRTIGGMPGVTEAVTIGVPDKTWGERVVSCVVTERPGWPSVEQVIEYCRLHMSREKIPSTVLVLTELPRGASGKIALPEVKRLVAARIAATVNATPAAATLDVEQVSARVLALAAQCFNVPVAELSLESEPESTEGWSSLGHMDFLLAIESTFNLKMAPRDMLSIVSLGGAVDYVVAKVFK